MPKSYELEKFLRYIPYKEGKKPIPKNKRQNILTKRSEIYFRKLKDNDANDIIVNS